MPKRPWYKWFPCDWFGDPDVRRLSYAERGLWRDMIDLMSQSDEPGVLCRSGEPWSVVDIAKATGGTEHEVRELLTGLLSRGVLSRREGDGAYYCRRMAREAKVSDARAQAGRVGGLISQGKGRFAQAKGRANFKQGLEQLLEQKPEQNSGSGSGSGSEAQAEGQAQRLEVGGVLGGVARAANGVAAAMYDRYPLARKREASIAAVQEAIDNGEVTAGLLASCIEAIRADHAAGRLEAVPTLENWVRDQGWRTYAPGGVRYSDIFFNG